MTGSLIFTLPSFLRGPIRTSVACSYPPNDSYRKKSALIPPSETPVAPPNARTGQPIRSSVTECSVASNTSPISLIPKACDVQSLISSIRMRPASSEQDVGTGPCRKDRGQGLAVDGDVGCLPDGFELIAYV